MRTVIASGLCISSLALGIAVASAAKTLKAPGDYEDTPLEGTTCAATATSCSGKFAIPSIESTPNDTDCPLPVSPKPRRTAPFR